MSERQKEVISQLKLFERTYLRLIDEGISVPSIWHYLAEDVFGPYGNMPCEGDALSDAPFILRGLLAKGICYLYEAQALMEKGPHFQSEALMAYDAGLETLEKVIRIGKKNPGIDFLPNYSTALRMNAEKDTFFMHPLAGCETIVTGMDAFPMQSPFTRKLIINVPLQTMHTAPFVSLENYRKRLAGWYENCSSVEQFSEAKETKFKQGSTDATARFFLSEFCPWGLGVYRTLRDAGLTRGLDWRILRPFAGEHPQEMSELSITKPFLVPNHIRGELDQIIGDGKSGYLDLEKTRPVRWEHVGSAPTYTIKYISPLVYERVRTDEQFSEAMGFVKFVFGGPLDWGVDFVTGKLFDLVGYYVDKDSEVYSASWLLYHANDKGFMTTESVTGSELSGMTFFKKTVGAAFVALEEKMVEDMYEGIEPQQVSSGKGYDGQPIPPILIRGDVLGFQKVPSIEYGRTIQPVRHYLFRPAAIALNVSDAPLLTSRNPGLELAMDVGLPIVSAADTNEPVYALNKNRGLGALRNGDYLKEQWANDPEKTEEVRKNAWEKLPLPFGTRDYITDFSPPFQIFKITLPKKEFGLWTQMLPKGKLLYAQLWQRSADEQNRLILNERIHDPALRLVVYNTHSPEGKSNYISAEAKYGAATHQRVIGTGRMHPATYRYFGPSDHRRQAVASLSMEMKNRLQTRYRLVITEGKDGKKLEEYPLVIAPGRGDAAIPVTGKITGLAGGGVVLNYNVPSKEFAGMSFLGNAKGPRLDAWLEKEVKESTKNSYMGGNGEFETRGFVCMSFDEKGQCVVKDFEYLIMRKKFLEKSNYSKQYKIWMNASDRETWVKMKLHFDPVVVRDYSNISGTYTCTANGATWIMEHIEGSIRKRNKEELKNIKSKGTWTVTQKDGVWQLKTYPGPAPIPEMLAPIEATFEEE
ncbi:hypothetical protein P4B35_10745 [Pontiellaceae bacterium B12227]|nr:hypothetical protein [Pontiellaceae bacterium B12227]